MEQVFADNFRRLGAAVPADVELGFHLCYGDLDAKHFIEPLDATKMVQLANLIARSVSRPITWLHMPVPIDRTDDAFYAPLKDLQLREGTELYLGLVHAQDGVDGTRRRIETAKKYVPIFGIASECGISRGRDSNLALEFIKIYGAAATAV
jgi:methionine synthase II (cobalamin-independent)